MRDKMIIALTLTLLCPLLGWAETSTKVPGVELFQVTGGPEKRAYDYAEPEAAGSPDQLVTMVVKDADVASVLQLLASQFRLNLLTTGDIKASVTFQFSNVPLTTALDVLVKAGGCNYVRTGDIIIVKPQKFEMTGDMDTKVFNLDYAEAEDVRSSVDKLLSNRGRADVGYRRVGEGGKSKRSSVLIVTDYPDNLTSVERIIRELDQPVPQIAIEAKFVETTISNEDLYGIEWTIRAGASAKVPPDEFKPGDELTYPLHASNIMLGTINFGQMAAVLDLLRSRGNGRLLANPRAITLDNQTAEMTMSTQVPLREIRIDPGTQAQTITWKTQTIPISLTVTPHVLADGSISMEVNPIVEAITGYVGPADDQKPITSKREAKTQVQVRDGEVVVIGGLVKEDATKNVSKVPVLGYIPVLGELFTKTSVKTSKTDLLVFIIPHVLPVQ